jgi:hypothetical protein
MSWCGMAYTHSMESCYCRLSSAMTKPYRSSKLGEQAELDLPNPKRFRYLIGIAVAEVDVYMALVMIHRYIIIHNILVYHLRPYHIHMHI